MKIIWYTLVIGNRPVLLKPIHAKSYGDVILCSVISVVLIQNAYTLFERKA